MIYVEFLTAMFNPSYNTFHPKLTNSYKFPVSVQTNQLYLLLENFSHFSVLSIPLVSYFCYNYYHFSHFIIQCYFFTQTFKTQILSNNFEVLNHLYLIGLYFCLYSNQMHYTKKEAHIPANTSTYAYIYINYLFYLRLFSTIWCNFGVKHHFSNPKSPILRILFCLGITPCPEEYIIFLRFGL